MESAILVRHGESEHSARGIFSSDAAVACPLTGLGREQARQLGSRLANAGVDVCVTTEFPRAVETADIALAGRDIPRIVMAELNEPRTGSFDGGRFVDYGAWARSASSAEHPAGGGESRQEIVARYARGYRGVLARPESTVLVVGHSLPIAYVLGALHGRDPEPIMPVIAYAEPHRVSAAELERAVQRLETWGQAPTW